MIVCVNPSFWLGKTGLMFYSFVSWLPGPRSTYPTVTSFIAGFFFSNVSKIVLNFSNMHMYRTIFFLYECEYSDQLVRISTNLTGSEVNDHISL